MDNKKSYRILWTGCFINLDSVELARVDLEKLGIEFDITLVCIYDDIDRHKLNPFTNIKLVCIEWTHQTVIDELLKSDVSVNPKFTNWKSYKSDNKTMMAWSLGIPCVERNYYEEIKKYLSSADLRNSDAKKYRAIIEKDYDVKKTAEEWVECVGKITETAQISKKEDVLPQNNNIVVYTAICGDYDLVRDDQFVEDGVDYIAFLDKPAESKVWNVKPIFKQFIDPSRQAKIYKVLPWLYMDCTYSIWMDGCVSIKVSPKDLIDEFLKNSDLAMFKHHSRDDIFDEYAADPKHLHRKLEPEYLFKMQIDKYAKEGFPKHSGLYECTIILRRHTEQIKRLCEMWWSQISAYTVCDQCSFMYSVWKTGIKVNTIPGTVLNNRYFDRGKRNYSLT